MRSPVLTARWDGLLQNFVAFGIAPPSVDFQYLPAVLI
jgi:hypothetical protein